MHQKLQASTSPTATLGSVLQGAGKVGSFGGFLRLLRLRSQCKDQSRHLDLLLRFDVFVLAVDIMFQMWPMSGSSVNYSCSKLTCMHKRTISHRVTLARIVTNVGLESRKCCMNSNMIHLSHRTKDPMWQMDNGPKIGPISDLGQKCCSLFLNRETHLRHIQAKQFARTFACSVNEALMS